MTKAVKLEKGGNGKSVFTKSDCDTLKGLATGGLTVNEIVAYFGICKQTFQNIRDRQPEVDLAYNQGFARAKGRVVKKLMQYIDDPALNQVNLTATIFYLKTKGGWVDSSKFIEREVTKVRQDLIDVKQIEDPKEMLSKIDKAIAAIDFLVQKDTKS
jgi:hypothetical protein